MLQTSASHSIQLQQLSSAQNHSQHVRRTNRLNRRVCVRAHLMYARAHMRHLEDQITKCELSPDWIAGIYNMGQYVKWLSVPVSVCYSCKEKKNQLNENVHELTPLDAAVWSKRYFWLRYASHECVYYFVQFICEFASKTARSSHIHNVMLLKFSIFFFCFIWKKKKKEKLSLHKIVRQFTIVLHEQTLM